MQLPPDLRNQLLYVLLKHTVSLPHSLSLPAPSPKVTTVFNFVFLFPMHVFLLFLYTYTHAQKIPFCMFSNFINWNHTWRVLLQLLSVLFIPFVTFVYPVATCYQLLSFLSPVMDAVVWLSTIYFSVLLLIDIWVVFQFLAITNNVTADTACISLCVYHQEFL